MIIFPFCEPLSGKGAHAWLQVSRDAPENAHSWYSVSDDDAVNKHMNTNSCNYPERSHNKLR